MAPGLGNGPWKWLLSCARSSLYRLEFFMWQLGCWDIHPRGCALIKDSSSGRFCAASCGHWPPFHPWACSYTTAPILGLPVASPTKALGWSHDSSDSWPAWPPATPPILSGSRLQWSQAALRVTLPNPPHKKWRVYPWALEGRISQVDSVKTSCQKWPTLCVILEQYSCSIIHVEKKLERYTEPSIISTIVTQSKFGDRKHLSGQTFTLSSSKCLGCAAWMDTSRIITLLRHCPPWAIFCSHFLHGSF